MILQYSKIDWNVIKQDVMSEGYALIKKVVSRQDCLKLIQCYGDDEIFRKRILMQRHNFGMGDYAYFAEPLPRLVAQLRTEFYRQLAPIANRMMESMRKVYRYPVTLQRFRVQCKEQGQTKPTPLILHYQTGGMNRLHRDLYGPTVFPLQVMVMLSQKGQDFEGGEFVLVENRPRQQSQVSVLTPDLGDLVIFPVNERPIKGKRGMFRATVRHGVSKIHSGERFVLGIIFHDAE